jgi:sulfur carrier protein ThiS
MTETTKNISIKFIGDARPAETVALQPGVTVADVLREIGLGSTGFVLIDPNNPDAVFRGSDNLYARANDGDVFAATAMVDAGRKAA